MEHTISCNKTLMKDDIMEISVIIAHPYSESFNHAIYQTVLDCLKKNGHQVHAHNLYEEGFNPLLEGLELATGETADPMLLKHRQEITKAHGIIIIHPNWWGQPPAILKGWTDRVLRSGVAYQFEEGDDGSGVPEGLLVAEAAIVFNTSNTPADREKLIFGDPLERIWKECVFDFCGIKNFHRKMFRVVASSTVKERDSWLKEVKETINNYFPKG
jgi:NAD(P)H dehydrogenase (quinone)